MAKLVGVYGEKTELLKRQLPLVVYENVKMVMDLNWLGCLYGNSIVCPKEVDKFLETFNTLTREEIREAFVVNEKDFFSLLKDTVPCVGCRRSVEKLYEQLKRSGHPTLEPLVIQSNGNLVIQEKHLDWPLRICSLLHEHSAKLTQLLESQLRSKKSHRCILHSLEYHRIARPTWKEVWDSMRPQCRKEVLLIPSTTLMITLENYLQKHRFCGDCRTKVLKAYWLLVEEPEPTREKGFIPGLYSGIKRCMPDKHLHLPSNTDYVSSIIARAQPDVMSSGERHAKTLEVAQGEIITCLGLVVHERLNRIQMRMKEEETTCQVLAAVAVDALSRNFQRAVDSKRGITKLELLYNEITKEEIAKQQRKEQKKLKKKKRKERKACETKADQANEFLDTSCSASSCALDENIPPLCSAENPNVELNVKKEDRSCSCEYGHDCGYSSGNNNAGSSPSSPEGSEACDEFCNEGVCHRSLKSSVTPEPVIPPNRTFTLSLEQMLEETASSDEESFIPLEDVRAFQARDNIPQKREELRQTLRMRFAQLCANNQNY
ncbi:gametogenetin-binding protein 2-like [Cimex lectularius]|uniref:Gametogenetin-binding protein 2-like n=1 Tax=Cimex lectularius TaxID=79782 RepID=A0A8I6RA03_CIMLE|nr:gametogenetin-binding protein 2-like [Cimex lectularius]